MESPDSLPPISTDCDRFMLGDESDGSEFCAVLEPPSPSDDARRRGSRRRRLNVGGHRTASRGSRHSTARCSHPTATEARCRPSRLESEPETDFSFEYATSDSQGPLSCTRTPHTALPRRPRPVRRCTSCIQIGQCSVCGCTFRSYRR